MDFWSALSGWKRYLLGISAALGVAGMVSQDRIQDTEAKLRAVPVEGHLTDSGGRQEGLRARPIGTSEGQGIFSGEAPWRDPMMRSYASRIGISFFVALLVGTLLRLFLRGMLMAMVLASILVVALVHYGAIEPFWAADSSFYEESAGWLKDQTNALKGMFVGHAPSGFAAAAGLVLGIRK